MAKRRDYHFETQPRRLKKPKSSLELSVFDRLFLGKKANKQDTPPTATAHTRSKSAGKVVHRLMMKHKQSLAKLDKERLATEQELLKELQDRPTICPLSAQIAEKAVLRELHEDVHGEPMEAKERTKVAPFTPVIERTSLAPVVLQAASVTARLMRSTFHLEEVKPFCTVNLRTRSCSALSSYNIELVAKGPKTPNYCSQTSRGDRDKVEGLRILRDLLATTYKIEVEEPPDLLDLNFFDRGRQWEETKRKKLAEKVEARTEQVLKECTFKPEISNVPTRTISRSSHLTKSMKYSTLHSKQSSAKSPLPAKANKENISIKELSHLLGNLDKTSPYSRLSPINATFGYKTGFNEQVFKPKKRGFGLPWGRA
jgi:hypothetical protein